MASRLASEGFHATVARGSGFGADLFAGLPGSTATAALTVRTTECPPGFAEDAEGEANVCEWGTGEGHAPAEDPGPFVALVDLKRDKELPGVWVVPSAEVKARVAPSDEPRPYRYLASAEELAPHEEDWDAVEEHLLRSRGSRTGWFERRDLAERYGERFVEALDAESSRLLNVENSITRRMADGRFPAEDLADASALLSVLFRRWIEEKRQR